MINCVVRLLYCDCIQILTECVLFFFVKTNELKEMCEVTFHSICCRACASLDIVSWFCLWTYDFSTFIQWYQCVLLFLGSKSSCSLSSCTEWQNKSSVFFLTFFPPNIMKNKIQSQSVSIMCLLKIFVNLLKAAQFWYVCAKISHKQ
jgi:hypothetical protein